MERTILKSISYYSAVYPFLIFSWDSSDHKHLNQIPKKTKKKNLWGLSTEDQAELQRRVTHAKENPDKLLSWEQIIKGIERKNGKKNSI